MIVNVRTFLRDFSAIRARARNGETVRVKDKDGEFLFTADALANPCWESLRERSLFVAI
jgi:hypothetical protein